MIQRKLAILLGAAALAMSAPASANIDQHVHMTFESGGVFDGTVTFLDDFSAYVGVNGTLTGGSNGYDSVMSWVYDNTNYSLVSGSFANYLMDGTPSEYENNIHLAYNYLAAPTLSFASGVSIYGIDNTVNGFDAMTGGSITAVPEPETYAMVLAGLGLISMMTRRRKA